MLLPLNKHKNELAVMCSLSQRNSAGRYQSYAKVVADMWSDCFTPKLF